MLLEFRLRTILYFRDVDVQAEPMQSLRSLIDKVAAHCLRASPDNHVVCETHVLASRTGDSITKLRVEVHKIEIRKQARAITDDVHRQSFGAFTIKTVPFVPRAEQMEEHVHRELETGALWPHRVLKSPQVYRV